MAQHLSISCLCAERPRMVPLRDGTEPERQADPDWALCHCDTCRYVTGLLCTSYAPIGEPGSLDGLVAYSSSAGSTRYFCATCGCHLFRSVARPAGGSAEAGPGQPVLEWGVATGAIVESSGGEADSASPGLAGAEISWRHLNVSDTGDGGLSIWLDKPAEIVESGNSSDGALANAPVEGDGDCGALPASCHCGNVRFYITRPDVDSRLPKSNFSDLITPYCRSDQEAIGNPSDTKWWLRDGDTKYLAGTCACRSCRLASGFEIQTWTFVPRSNIYFHTNRSQQHDQGSTERLNFETLPTGILKSYVSSPGVAREFCPRCGATVFWHDKWRPELIDVSVGLLRAQEGARASTWLDWWTGRVSFAEETLRQRRGAAARRARELIRQLEAGLGDWERRS